MHVPDGFLDVPTSLTTGVVAATAIGVALHRGRHELDERAVPLAGMTAAFVFAGQMVNFPVGLGTSGHLMGGALAAVLVGPWTAVLSVSVVLLVQALLFADGGLTALGTNITLLGVTAVAVGWFATRAALRLLPRRPRSAVPASAVGAFASVVAAAALFVALYAAGGAAPVPLGALTAAMLGWHALIGAGEATITALTVGAVVAVRPDLVRAVHDLRPVLTSASGEPLPSAGGGPVHGRPTSGGPRRRPAPRVVLAGLAVASVLLVVVGAPLASSDPDGLEQVAEQTGFLGTARDHLLGTSALADYGAVGGIPVWAAGLVGVAATVVVGLALFRLAGRSRRGVSGAVGAPRG
ncbi:energy-coupling factor ABC transporter permease [Actinotalea sp. Marseille-Q4924]|uniref:energy-coupling factor ABC transporter permease n=1 Tax=Actinotalea sp. Marseille-Q4924 TaxID=2866571 RepID=UPI001CE43523|nr:energy-coupling factor ABC transporter permease [Actinotalea sp. Marseille-Q4924]